MPKRTPAVIAFEGTPVSIKSSAFATWAIVAKSIVRGKIIFFILNRNLSVKVMFFLAKSVRSPTFRLFNLLNRKTIEKNQ